MANDALLTLSDAAVSYGGKEVFENLSLTVHTNDRISLVGKNGAGKTTLMRLIAGSQEMDLGERWEQPHLKMGFLKQEVMTQPDMSVHEFVLQGLPEKERTEDKHYMADQILGPFMLDPQKTLGELSGGQLRQASLAQSLVHEPDILLLDEPTNHLDLGAIEWLESYLRHYSGSLLCISHDKRFLANISNKIFWLDRGNLRVCPKGFGHFEEWSEMLLDQEARELENRARAVSQELEWANRGVKARRKRNVRRLEQLQIAREKLKKDQSSYRQATKKINMGDMEAAESSRAIVEYIKANKAFTNDTSKTTILNNFNMRIMRGDRIGILGKNGSGKTTFLKTLLGEEELDSGKLKRAKTLEISYFDQKREDLDPQKTLWTTLCPGGGDYVDVNGKSRHVCGYLKDFLFDPKYAQDKVATLSGGQRNRLLLAKILANPGSVLVLDEPTNDLDMDTVEMLEDILANYKGTLFIVSHDRDFLDQTVTKILAFEGDGQIEEVIGGYSDYLAHIKGNVSSMKRSDEKEEKQLKKEEAKTQAKPAKKLSYKLQYELDNLPTKIKTLEAEIASLQTQLSDPDLFQSNPDAFTHASTRIEEAKTELDTAELRWLELEEMAS